MMNKSDIKKSLKYTLKKKKKKNKNKSLLSNEACLHLSAESRSGKDFFFHLNKAYHTSDLG